MVTYVLAGKWLLFVTRLANASRLSCSPDECAWTTYMTYQPGAKELVPVQSIKPRQTTLSPSRRYIVLHQRSISTAWFTPPSVSFCFFPLPLPPPLRCCSLTLSSRSEVLWLDVTNHSFLTCVCCWPCSLFALCGPHSLPGELTHVFFIFFATL
ncbi:hypothetical protein F5B17DRAFT_60219 [Nemania serpens]|nr:hypothetical protein F5B17DRAFT_60219 [Nemania serpens]